MANVTNAQLINGQFRTKNFVSSHHIDTQSYSIANYKKQIRLLTKRDSLLPVRNKQLQQQHQHPYHDHQTEEILFNDGLSQKSTNTNKNNKNRTYAQNDDLFTHITASSKATTTNGGIHYNFNGANRNGNSRSQQSLYALHQHRLLHNFTTVSEHQGYTVQYKPAANKITANGVSIQQQQQQQLQQQKQKALKPISKTTSINMRVGVSPSSPKPESRTDLTTPTPASSTRLQFIQLNKPISKLTANNISSNRKTAFFEQKMQLFDKEKIKNDIKFIHSTLEDTTTDVPEQIIRKHQQQLQLTQNNKMVNETSDSHLDLLKIKKRELSGLTAVTATTTTLANDKRYEFIKPSTTQQQLFFSHNNSHNFKNLNLNSHKTYSIESSIEPPTQSEPIKIKVEDKCRTATIVKNNNSEDEDEDDCKSDSSGTLLSSSDRSCELLYSCPPQSKQIFYNNNHTNLINTKMLQFNHSHQSNSNQINSQNSNRLKPINETYHIDGLSDVHTISSNEDNSSKDNFSQASSKSKNIKDVKKNILQNLNKRLSAKSNLN